ncbi:ATP-binding cassette domain-containing protein [Mesosutterella sp. OilRF-GAM-744-9]|uniref:ATP-binding cassette domain-containing protein n=2 Tax=Mesosutterella TaxID=2494213 RepID=A0ABS9MSQ4_9BURK|nr:MULTISPECIES: ATP-binding cassette domain-containing protein [unclassified Mesosutterella]MCG5031354.1 ATP-binding cassette domain-containing protein [Mesosutterella sp. oilRF-744-WT-GAM-9]MDL2059474.1 ATP-binding cassette domain-containing protein [Mesosutterella sp. AGMB02718]
MIKTIKQFVLSKIDPDIRRLMGYFPPYKWRIIFSVIFMILAGLGSSLIAKLLGLLTNVGFYDQKAWIIIAAPIGLIFIALLNGGSMFMSNYLLGEVSQAVLQTIRSQIFHRILRWPSSLYQTNSTGMVSSKFVFEANFGLSNATKAFIVLVRDSCQVFALTLMLVWHNALLSIVCLIIGPMVIYLLRFISSKLKSIMASSQMSIAVLLVRVKEAYEAHQLIKVSGTYPAEIEKFSKINREIKNLKLRMTRVSSLGTPATQFICMFGVAVVLTMAMIQTQLGMLTLGDFVTFLAALLLIMPPLRHLTGLNSSFVMMKVAANSIFDTLDQPLEPDNGQISISSAKGNLEFKHVCLKYPNSTDYAVHDFNLKVNSGDCIALVGLSGSGKSSVVNLIPRFWNPSSGNIYLDGIDTQNISLKSLRNQISIVSQDVILFDDTIRANIVYGSPNATEEEINEAVRASALEDFISSLSLGLDTPIGEAGDRLSGGQKQRISIARAILKKAPILIFDEATSALDSVSENQIKTSLSRLMKGKTTFVVAHRLSTIDIADYVVVMSKGTIAEFGKPSVLFNKNGLFTHLCKLQNIKIF